MIVTSLTDEELLEAGFPIGYNKQFHETFLRNLVAPKAPKGRNPATEQYVDIDLNELSFTEVINKLQEIGRPEAILSYSSDYDGDVKMYYRYIPEVDKDDPAAVKWREYNETILKYNRKVFECYEMYGRYVSLVATKEIAESERKTYEKLKKKYGESD